MMKRRYRFHMDSATWCWTLLHMLVFAVVAFFTYMLYDGRLFYAWFLAILGAGVVLMLLSIPWSVELDDDRLKIKCFLDVTSIDIDNIISVQKVSPRKIRWVLPIFGGCGFFGYYGHFFDLRHLRKVVIYATEWRYLVEIVDSNEDYYYISCRGRDELVDEILSHFEQDDTDLSTDNTDNIDNIDDAKRRVGEVIELTLF